MRKLGLIAGGGELPFALARRCQIAGRPFFVARLRGFADPGLEHYPGAEIGLAELGRMFATLKREGVEAVCFAGMVKRPDFSALKPDLRGLKSLPGAISAARQGDDALLRFLLGEFEREGFHVEGAHQVDDSLTLPLGPLGAYGAGDAHAADLARAIDAACAIGQLDIGQGVVVVDGVVLAVEAQEGTDVMLRRCVELPAELKGTPANRRGVLVKWPKPIQERRMDMPTIGVATVELAAAAGLAGIVGEAHSLLVMDREGVIAAANRLGLFICGAPARAEP